eukprot:gene2557-3519_t
MKQQHILPKLDYPIEGLFNFSNSSKDGIAPCISAKQLDYHYNKHHNGYVVKLNKLVEGTNYETSALEKIIVESAVDSKQVAIFNNAAQHFNHSFYWKCLTPNSNENVKGCDSLMESIKKSFGSFEEFKEEFTQRTVNLFGSGWCWLVYDGNKLSIWTGPNASCPLTENKIPLLTCDIWEHAYYLDHQNRRPDYLKGFWNIVNWQFVQSNFVKALEVSK